MTSEGRRSWTRRVATVAVATFVMFLAVPAAWAHGELERSDPPNGGMVAEGRSTLTLWFGEPVSPRASSFDLRAQDGRRIPVRVSSTRDAGRVVGLETDPLPRSTYELEWRVFSLDDGHPSSGSLVFGAGLRPDVVPTRGAGLPPAAVLILRWLDLTGVLLAFGALVVSGRVLGSLGEAGRQPRRRARTIGMLAAAATVYAGLLTPFISTHRSGTPLDTWFDATWSTLRDTPWGHLWLAREAALMIAAAAIWSWARHPRGSVRRVRYAMAGLVVASLLESLAGHASSLPHRSGAAALVSSAHIVAAGVWAGGLGVLVLCLVPVMRRAPDMRGVILSSVWRTYSPMAGVASVVLLATGLYEAGRHLPAVGSLTSTLYGGAVAGKSILLVTALAMAGINTLLVNPQLAGGLGHVLDRPAGWAPVSRTKFTAMVTGEVLVLLAAVGLAALLTSTPTAREVGLANQVTAPHAENVDGLFITFEDVPADSERSRLVVRVRATVLPEPAPVGGVDVVLSGPRGAQNEIPLRPVEEGLFEAESTAPTPGAWTATVSVHRAGLSDAVTQATWKAAGRASAAASPLEPVGTGLAVLLLAGVLAGTWLARRRPDPVPLPTPAQRDKEVSLR